MSDDIKQAARLIKTGKIVCFPTETVYALAANAENAESIYGIYKLKGRDFKKPLALLVKNITDAEKVALVDKRAEKLFSAFSPGPLTLILPKIPRTSVAKNINPDGSTIAVRIPDNKIALDILEEAGCFVAATSTNISGSPEATDAQMVRSYFGEDDLYLIDGGKCDIGLASTIIDLSGEKAIIVRQGNITSDQIFTVLGK